MSYPRRRMSDVSIDDDVAELAGLGEGQPITDAQAEGWLPKTCFKHGPPGRIGIELEFLVHDEPGHGLSQSLGLGTARHLEPERLQKLFDDLEHRPLDSSFTVEPGGQVELS